MVILKTIHRFHDTLSCFKNQRPYAFFKVPAVPKKRKNIAIKNVGMRICTLNWDFFSRGVMGGSFFSYLVKIKKNAKYITCMGMRGYTITSKAKAKLF